MDLPNSLFKAQEIWRTAKGMRLHTTPPTRETHESRKKKWKPHATTFGKQSPGRPELLGDTYTKPWIRSARGNRTLAMFCTVYTHTRGHRAL